MPDAVSAYDDIQMWMESLHVKDAINAHHKLAQAIKQDRIDALEDAEKACEALATRWLENTGMGDARMAARACAQSIRAMIEKETSNAT